MLYERPSEFHEFVTTISHPAAYVVVTLADRTRGHQVRFALASIFPSAASPATNLGIRQCDGSGPTLTRLSRAYRHPCDQCDRICVDTKCAHSAGYNGVAHSGDA